jgi:hypothetical protein
VLARLALSRKVNSVAMEAHPGAMEYQPGILEAPTELLSTVASPGAVETIPAILLEQWWLSLKPSVTSWSKGYSKPWSPIPGSHEEPQLELEGCLRAIML